MSAQESELSDDRPSSNTEGSDPTAPPLERWSVRVAYLMAALATLVRIDADRLVDGDLFVNFYSGREIWERGWVPYVDPVTFSVAGRAWIDYEWLGRFSTYMIHEVFGGPGLVATRLVLGIALLLLLFFQARRHSRGPLPFMIVCAFLMVLVAPFFIFRTTLITFIAIPALLVLLDRAREGKPWLVWLVPLLIVPWVNLHGGFALGVVLLGVAAGESVAVLVLARARWLPSGGALGEVLPVRHIVGAFAATVVLTGLNPFGYRDWGAVFHTMGSEFTPQISEWWPLYEYGWGMQAPVYALMLLVVLAMAIAWRRARLFDLAVCGMLAVSTVRHFRFIPLFTLVAAVVLLRLLPAAGERLGAAHLPRKAWATTLAVVATVVFVVLLVREGHTDPYVRKNEWWTPVGGVAFLEENGFSGRIFNEYDWGGYIRYMLPESTIFVDGRSETIYPPEILEDWGQFVKAQGPDWRAIPDRYDAQAVFLRNAQPAVAALRGDPDWLYAFADRHSSIFIRDSAENAEFVERLRAGRTTSPSLTPDDFLLK